MGGGTGHVACNLSDALCCINVTELSQLSPAPRLADQAYEAIRNAIINHELVPGQHLSVPELARRLGVSRSPVREALLTLEREGLVRSLPHRGAVVAHAEQEDLWELYEAREALEGYIARLAAVRLTDEELRSLRELFEVHQTAVETGDLDGHVGIDLKFHGLVRDGSRNRRLIELHEMLEAQIRVALYGTGSRPENRDLAISEHRGLLEALEARDEELAEQRAREHVRRVRQWLVEAHSASPNK